MLEQLYQFERLQSMITAVTCQLLLVLKDWRILCPSDVGVTAPISYFSSGPLGASDSIRVHGQWRLEVVMKPDLSRRYVRFIPGTEPLVFGALQWPIMLA